MKSSTLQCPGGSTTSACPQPQWKQTSQSAVKDIELPHIHTQHIDLIARSWPPSFPFHATLCGHARAITRLNPTLASLNVLRVRVASQVRKKITRDPALACCKASGHARPPGVFVALAPQHTHAITMRDRRSSSGKRRPLESEIARGAAMGAWRAAPCFATARATASASAASMASTICCKLAWGLCVRAVVSLPHGARRRAVSRGGQRLSLERSAPSRATTQPMRPST